MDPEEEEEEDTRPKVKKKHIVLPDERISLKSPRLVAAMKSSGVSLDELRPVAESDIVKNVKLTEIAHRRREAFATQQAMVPPPPAARQLTRRSHARTRAHTHASPTEVRARPGCAHGTGCSGVGHAGAGPGAQDSRGHHRVERSAGGP